ncbi:cyclin-D5-1 isoform X2 [Beta vulgaris subsp. vulgaris]|uniref:cyclin-D5-1 isoform X2 n=1 Tax=Beta vulgaris subsp. vulgaris TaxID=3555 RepID=UPI002546EE18|nr:cyclin-D5-1 isoform X2 [Beta vulgaris subsp. vulgaris]
MIMHNFTSKTYSLTSLFCEENDDKTCVFQHVDQHPLFNSTNIEYFNANFDVISEFEEDGYINILLQREINSGFTQRSQILPITTSKSSRNHAINYILHMGAMLGFQLQTAYLSLCYFDLFLSKRSIDEEKSWAIELILVACLSVAAKLEENKVPSLSDFFQVGDIKYEYEVIQKMELLVLNTLEWKVRIVTPFAYLPYFINKFCDVPRFQGSSSTINQLILAFMRACGSILVALDRSLSREAIELKTNTILPSRFLDIEDILTCYNIMLQLETHTTKVLNSPDSPHQSSIHLFENAQATSFLCTKRSLTFEEADDQKYDDLCKKSRHCLV